MNESKIRIEQYEQAADRVSLNGIKWERKWDVRIQCDSREEADRVREALTNPERQEQEPVAWRWSESEGKRWFDWTTDWTHHDRAKAMGFTVEYAYTAPQRREWAGLTEDHVWYEIVQATIGGELHPDKLARAIEAALKERNA